MKAIALAIVGTLTLGSVAIAAEGGSGTTKSGTMNRAFRKPCRRPKERTYPLCF